MKVEVRGDGIAACCCVRLLREAGIDTSFVRLDRPRVPALLLSFPALQLIRDVFARTDLLASRAPVRKRVVRWDSALPTAELEHLGFVTSEEELLRQVAPAESVSCGQPDWVVHCANPLPADVSHVHFGSRKATASKVALRAGDACAMESFGGGWLFLLPVDDRTGWLLSVGEVALRDSSVIAPRIAEVLEQTGDFPAYPRIADRLTGTNWITCGSAAMAFDPICGDGTALAVRAAILAAAALRAVARGDGPEALLRHYESRVRAGFSRHIELCRQYYRRGFGGPWWQAESDALDRWMAPAEIVYEYRLLGFDLQRISR